MTCSARSLGSASSSCSRQRLFPGWTSAAGCRRSGAGAHASLRGGHALQAKRRSTGTATSPANVAEIEKEHVGRRVQPAQRAINIERLGIGLTGQALGKHYLENIAGRDVLLPSADHLHVIFTYFVGAQFRRNRFALTCGPLRQRCGKPLTQPVQACFGLLQLAVAFRHRHQHQPTAAPPATRACRRPIR